MGLILQALACVSAVASLAASAALPAGNDQLLRRDDCSNGPYASVLTIGGKTGKDETPFCESRLQATGEIITALEVWSDKKGITGILFTYSSNDTAMQGYQTGNSQSMTLAPGELVTTATLWGDGVGTHLGHIYLKTDKQEFDTGMDKKNNGYPISTGGGLLLGGSGAVGKTYVTSLAFLFLNSQIDSVTIGSIKFDQDPTGSSTNIEPSYLLQSTMGNPAGSHGNVSFTISGSQAVTQSTTWEQSTTGTFGASYTVTVDAAPLGIGASASGSYTWSVAHTSSKTTSTSDTITLTQSAGPIPIAPGYGKDCTIVAQKGTGNFPYSSTVVVNLVGGGSFSYQEKGQLDSVQYSTAVASCQDENDPKAWTSTTDNPPQGVNVVGTS